MKLLTMRTTQAIMFGACLLLIVSLLPACSPQGSGTILTVGTVNNTQMIQMEQLTRQVFQKEHPDIKVNFVTLPENDLRDKVTEDVATGAGLFDLATIGNYDVPIWAHNGWLVNLSSYLSQMSPAEQKSYNYNDFIKPIMSSISYQGHPYALPFYGESSIIMYNKQMFAAHHLTMPLHPTWDQIAQFAKVLNDPSHGVAGILLRGQSGWGMNLAPLDTVINTFGGSWFNMQWQPQMTSPATEKAVSFYTNLLRNYGEPGPSTADFQTCIGLMTQGKGAMFYDASSDAGVLETPSQSKVAGNVGYAYAPTEVTPNGSRWLYSWNLGIINSSHKKNAAFQFLTWATSPQYINLAKKTFGEVNVPPGTRYSTYQDANYIKAAPFAQLTLDSINTATPDHPTMMPVPYTGVQFVEIPQFESSGEQVSEYISAAIAGKISVHQALQQADQQLSSQVNAQNTKGY